MSGLLCTCGCGTPARWLISGSDFDPATEAEGEPYVKVPACHEAMLWCEQSSAELGFAFEKEPVP